MMFSRKKKTSHNRIYESILKQDEKSLCFAVQFYEP